MKEGVLSSRVRARAQGQAARADVQIQNEKGGVPVLKKWVDAQGWRKEAAALHSREGKDLRTSPCAPGQAPGRLALPPALSTRPFLAADRGPAPKRRRVGIRGTKGIDVKYILKYTVYTQILHSLPLKA